MKTLSLQTPLKPDKKTLRLRFPRHKSHPHQAGFFKRLFAWLVDILLVILIAMLVYIGFTEIRGLLTDTPGLVSQFVQAERSGKSTRIILGSHDLVEKFTHERYLESLKDKLTPIEYERAVQMSNEQIEAAFPVDFAAVEEELAVFSPGQVFHLFQLEFLVI